jgi:hypothetical protein
MALINLKTQYTSLKFGNDQKGGGDSGLPYVKFDTNGNAQTPSGVISVAGTVQFDFPKRGGTYPSNLIDLARIKAFLADNKGKIFVDKQKTLQFMNPKMETGPSFLDSNQAKTLPGLVENTRVYSTDNLLGQISIEGTGGHLSRVGLPYFGVKDEFYANTVGIQNLTNSAVTNRLLLLSRLKIASGRTGNTFSSFDNALSVGEDFAMAKKMGIAINNTLIFNYPGGPNSSYGVGSTVIRRAVDTTLNTLPNVMNYAQIMQQNAIKDGPISSNSIKDFRSNLQSYKEASKTNTSTVWNSDKTMENRIKIANPGKIIKDPNGVTPGKPIDYTAYVSADIINYKAPLIVSAAVNNDTDIYNAMPDSIKFGFECMSNDKPGDSILLQFRALLSNGFTDNHTALLNSFRYIGRGEEFHTYQGFTRAISFSFKIAAFSRAEMYGIYSKLNQLISQVYPDYSPNTNVMRAPLVKVTIGDYLYRVPGFLESVNITADNNTPWEINLEGDTAPFNDISENQLSDNSKKVQQLPHMIEVAVSFKPILNILPKRQVNGQGGVELISHSKYLWAPPKQNPTPAAETPNKMPNTTNKTPPPDTTDYTPSQNASRGSIIEN